LQEIPSTYHSFGNNGSIPYNQPVNYSGNTALRHVPNRTTVLTDMTHTSDHIPLFMNYTIGSAAGTATHFSVSATPSIIAGSPFDFTVTALDANNNIATGYRGTVTFSSGDPYGASLPPNYTFQAADNGVKSFSNGATLYTAGSWDVTATDINSGITGSANVTAAPAASFQIIAPSTASSGVAFDVTVIATDPYGNTDTNYGGTITWTSSDTDPNVVLPSDYPFQPGDQGQVTFPGGVTLITPGNQSITATDTVSGINGTATVTVTMSPLTDRGFQGGQLAAAPTGQIPAGQLASGTTACPGLPGDPAEPTPLNDLCLIVAGNVPTLPIQTEVAMDDFCCAMQDARQML
jgi:hypothetical protein